MSMVLQVATLLGGLVIATVFLVVVHEVREARRIEREYRARLERGGRQYADWDRRR